MVDFTSDTLLGDIRRCILKKKMDLGNIGGFRVPKKALFSGFQPFFGHFKGPEWCQTKIQGHATPAERSPMIAERICGFWFQGSFVQIMAHCAVLSHIFESAQVFSAMTLRGLPLTSGSQPDSKFLIRPLCTSSSVPSSRGSSPQE